MLEQGEIDSSSNIEVNCEVKSRGSSGISILWVVDEGTAVKKGDKLVELDSSQMEQTLNEDKIRVIAAEANVTTAKAAVEQAKIAREEYLEGRLQNGGASDPERESDRRARTSQGEAGAQSSERLVAKGLVKSLQLDADRFAVANAGINSRPLRGK